MGRVPRLAQRRVILFFWPMRASSANQISIVSQSIASRVRLSPGARESFFKILDRARGLRVMARPCRELAVAHGAQFPTERLLGDRDAEFFEDPLRQIDQSPAHHAVDCRNRALSIMRAMAWRWTSLSFDG